MCDVDFGGEGLISGPVSFTCPILVYCSIRFKRLVSGKGFWLGLSLFMIWLLSALAWMVGICCSIDVLPCIKVFSQHRHVVLAGI